MEQRTPHLGVLIEAYRGVLAELLNATTLDDVADMVARSARIALGAEGATVSRVEDEAYIYVATSGAPAPPLGRRRPLVGSFTGKVVAARQGRFFDLEAEPASATRASQDGIVSGIVVPILVGERVVGTLGVTSERKHAFDALSMDALVGFAEHLAIALALHARVDPVLVGRLISRGQRLLATRLDDEQRDLVEGMVQDAQALSPPG